MRQTAQTIRVAAEQIQAVRRFNRFYTRAIGTLQDGALYRPYSLAEARVLYEIGSGVRDHPQASEIAEQLRLDEAYLSRILSKFEKNRLLTKEASPSDRRQNFLRLAAPGRKALADLNNRSIRAVSALLRPLTLDERSRLLTAMKSVEQLLSDNGKP